MSAPAQPFSLLRSLAILLLWLSMLQSSDSFAIRNRRHHRAHPSSCSSFVSLSSSPAAAASPRLLLLGGLFGGDTDKKNNGEDLAIYENLATSDVKYQSLSDYVSTWSKLLEGKGMGLTTPVKVRASVSQPIDDESVVDHSGVQILFQKVESGYKSKKEEDQYEQQDEPKKEKKVIKQGGVEILVEKLKDDSVQVRARRCEMEEETVIKEMSEATILKELKTALDVWKKEQQS